ncbi:polyketide cyclase [Candidatus Pantoea soli]|uniref:Polyketide cyclase n=1 Tax=Candidatus Pantoea soli TaxID=3098669 RepID=A0A518XH63_9GAMM|nr:polyketide cyclase [Pantoea soli]QDY43489.1 polyketide cyclase [Pantoea soli]
MLPSQTVTITVPRNWLDLYETIWKPECFAKWVEGLRSSTLIQESNYWKAKGPQGCMKLRFTPHNPFGVMDHWIDTGSGKEIYMPMRVVANEQGAEIVTVVYRQPLTSDDKFSRDVERVKQDLERLLYQLTH